MNQQTIKSTQHYILKKIGETEERVLEKVGEIDHRVSEWSIKFEEQSQHIRELTHQLNKNHAESKCTRTATY